MAEETEFSPARRDVVFGSGGGRDLLCDVYLPEQATKRTAVIHLHGGGFRGGSKQMMAPKVQAYLRLGYICVAPQYRLSGEAKWPAQLEDVKASVRWVRANVESLGIEPARIVVAGYSAGGLLALMASSTMGRAELEGSGGNAGVSSDVAACLAYYAAAEVRRGADGAAHQLMAEGVSDADYRAASPVFNVSARSAPAVLFHGLADVTIPPAASERLSRALIEAGVPAELHTFHGVPHEFDRHPEFSARCAAVADLFLDHQLLNPRSYPPFAIRPQPATA
jgi:acetyl esterase/lipase